MSDHDYARQAVLSAALEWRNARKERRDLLLGAGDDSSVDVSVARYKKSIEQLEGSANRLWPLGASIEKALASATPADLGSEEDLGKALDMLDELAVGMAAAAAILKDRPDAARAFVAVGMRIAQKLRDVAAAIDRSASEVIASLPKAEGHPRDNT